MKARLLKTILNNTLYTVGHDADCIFVGSSLCHNLLSVDKKTLQVKYALDTFHEGRKAVVRSTDELLFIYDTLQGLIETGAIHDIMEGEDTIIDPLPVFTVIDGKLIETVTDEYGWPNTTITGEIMYNNTYFKDKKKAIEYGIRESDAYLMMIARRLGHTREDLETWEKIGEEQTSILIHLRSLLAEVKFEGKEAK